MTDTQNKTIVHHTPESALAQMRQQNAVIIDVREPHEYRNEHIAGALSLPLADLTSAQLPKDKTAILYCGVGKRSCTVAQQLIASGYRDIAVVDGGIVSWKAAGLPTTKPLQAYAPEEIQAAVADRYGRVATSPDDKFNFPVGRRFAESVGYDIDQLDRLPSGLWESFTGAGNPQAFVDVQPGQTILDLGCGAGLDLYLYAQKVGPTGMLYGLDLSSAMLNKARHNLAEAGVANIEWLHAPANAIPLPDNSVDLVTANGIYNLSPDKEAVMREVSRVLKPGGHTVFAEIVLKSELPGEVRQEIDDWFRCIGGALVQQDFLVRLERNGLSHPQILWMGRNARTGHELSLSAVIRAEKQTQP